MAAAAPDLVDHRASGLARKPPIVQLPKMTVSRYSKLFSLAWIAGITALFVAVFVTRSHESPYAPVASYAGCYSNGTDRLQLGPKGELNINGAAVGSHQIVKPVGGKHGFLVEANGLTLAGGNGKPIRAKRGEGGFLWPISDQSLEVIFAPDVEMTFRKVQTSFC